MMPEETTTPAVTNDNPTPQTPAPEPKPSGADDSGAGKTPKTFDEAYVKELRGEAADWRKKFRDLENQFEQINTEQKQKKEAELKDNQKWEELAQKREKELAELKTALENERVNNLRIRIGAEFKLPSKLVDRLQGTTEDELRTDAETLVKELGLDKQPETAPTQPAHPARRQQTAVSPDGTPSGETDDQRRDRLYKRGVMKSPLFDNPNT